MFVGIDLGTSGVKLLLVNQKGDVLKEVCKTYPIFYPLSHYSEQNPTDWWKATKEGLKELLLFEDKEKIKGISFGGQMHGLVVLDKNNEVIRPAILWNDGRAQEEVDYFNQTIGKKTLMEKTGNIAYAGFTAPKILWMKKNEPENFKKMRMILLPKDYLAFQFIGEFSTDYSDAAGTLLFDVKNKCWSKEMCALLGITSNQLPQLYESYEEIGTIKKELANEFGLSENVKIIAGAGDNAAAAIGTGCVFANSCNISLGTSGTIFVSLDHYLQENHEAIHQFNHANGKYHQMACILSAASCNQWWIKNILESSYQSELEIPFDELGKNEVYFLPYLMGERCPHNDNHIRGSFVNISASTTRKQMTQAILEGVAFALKDCIQYMNSISSATLCGGGAKSEVWAQIIANVLNIQLNFVKTEQGPGYGAAILAMVGCKIYPTVEKACQEIIQRVRFIEPSISLSKDYQEKYEGYKKIYPALKSL